MKKRYVASFLLVYGFLFALSIGYQMRIADRVTASVATVGYGVKPISSIQTEAPQVAFTFDVDATDEYVESILAILKEQQVKAAFFLTGAWVEHHKALVQIIYESGHVLGNHSTSHKNMMDLSSTKQTEELQTLHKTVEALTGYEMKLFRPPYGEYNDSVLRTAKQNGYHTILWNVDSQDWKGYGAQAIVEQITNNPDLQNGSIFLFHCNNEDTVKALPQIIQSLREQGFGFIDFSQIF